MRIPVLERPPQLEQFIDGPRDTPMAMVTGFTQRWPYDGRPPSRKTIVYLGYDRRQLYVVFLAYDDPDLVRATLAPRERIWDDDDVGIMIDAFNDRRRAYRFTANPYGVQRDQFYVDGQQFDSSYDTVWASEGRVTDWGYVVRMAIPFKSLRFSPAAVQEWGIVLTRGIERLNETNTWPHVSSARSGYLAQAASASGIENVSPGGNLLVIPYSTANLSSGIEDDGMPRFRDEEFTAKAGVDIKRVWNDNIVTDLTINPDFSQVESDQPQVTVNQRFEVFFPERRPFFLENADLFRTPFNLLFTRRIADPELGLRLTGKLGPWAVGSFVIDDEAPGKRLPAAHPDHGEKAIFAAGRVIRDIGSQSRMGVMAVRREFGDDRNTVAGVDGYFKWGDQWATVTQAVHSRTRQPEAGDETGHAFFVDIRRTGRHFDYEGFVNVISEDYDAQAGFVRRTGIRTVGQWVQFSGWPEDPRILKWDTSLGANVVWDDAGNRLDKTIDAQFELEFPGQTEIEVGAGYARERLLAEEFPTLATDRDFDADWVSVELEAERWKRFGFQLGTSVGKRANFRPLPGLAPGAADWMESTLQLTFRPTDQITIDTSTVFTRLENEDSGNNIFDDFISRARVNWQFTRELSLRAIIQHERTKPNPLETTLADRKNWNYDLLFTYRVNPWTAIYLGYNTNRQNIVIEEVGNMRRIVRTDDLHEDSEQLLLKFSYLFSS